LERLENNAITNFEINDVLSISVVQYMIFCIVVLWKNIPVTAAVLDIENKN
jgi:hypothetical protein